MIESYIVLFVTLANSVMLIRTLQLVTKGMLSLEQAVFFQRQQNAQYNELLSKLELMLKNQSPVISTDGEDDPARAIETRNAHLMTLVDTIIWTDEDWQYFKLTFEKIHPGFLGRIKVRHGDLTPAEIRLITLIKLNVPVRKMAFMLNVNKETIHKSRYRLKRKLGYSDLDIDLENIVANM